MAQIMRVTDVCRQTVFTGRATVMAGGGAALLARGAAPGRTPTGRGAVAAEFVTRLEAGQFRQARDAPAWIKKRPRRQLTGRGVRQFLHRVGGKLKGPRKPRAKQDSAKAELPGAADGDRGSGARPAGAAAACCR